MMPQFATPKHNIGFVEEWGHHIIKALGWIERGRVKKKILAIGAYERDNFGDLLFYQMLKSFLRNHDVIAGSIMYSDMRQTLGEKVLPYTHLLEQHPWDAVWVVGGEVGGVDIDMAYRMSLDQSNVDVYDRLSPAKKRLVQQTLSAGSVPEMAYLPELDRLKLEKRPRLIINSVGVSNISLMQDQAHRRRSNKVLRSATILSVRDEESSRYCERYDIPATLNPDVVHAIAKLPEWKALKKAKQTSRYVSFQISHHLLSSFGRNVVVDTLVELIRTLKMRVVLVAAGTAVHHDSYAEYQWVKALVQEKVGDGKIDILYSRQPSDIVATVINSSLWIGTSLHGRIIAGAFGVPRVSLQNQKVHRYATTWDDDYPSNVMIGDALVSAKLALDRWRSDNNDAERSKNLIDMAYNQLVAMQEAFI